MRNNCVSVGDRRLPSRGNRKNIGILTVALLSSLLSTLAHSPAHAQRAQPVNNPYQSLPAVRAMLGGHIYYHNFPLPHLGIGNKLRPWKSPDNILYQLASYLSTRVDQSGTINTALLRRALLAKQKMSSGPLHLDFVHPVGNHGGYSTMGLPAGGGIDPWGTAIFDSIGPLNMLPPYANHFGTQVVSGRVNGIAFDPNNPGTYYIATAGGGVWKTTDAGLNWNCLSNDTNTWEAQTTACVAVDPQNSSIIYVGTGDIFSFKSPFGIMKSADGGATWVNEGNGVFPGTVYKVKVDPDNDLVVNAISGGNIYHSTDGGRNWNIAASTNGLLEDMQYGLRIPDANGNLGSHILLVTGQYAGVMMSSDDGAHWNTLDNGSTLTSNGGGCSVAPSPTRWNYYYVLDGGNQRIYLETFNTSFNNQYIASAVDITGSMGYLTDEWSQQGYDFYIRAASSAVGKDQVFVGLKDLFEYNGRLGIKGEAIWEPLFRSNTAQSIAHTDQHAMALDPNDASQTHFLIGNDGGIYDLVVKQDKFATISTLQVSSLNADLDITQFYKVAAISSEFGWLLGGAQDQGAGTSNVGGPSYTDYYNWKIVSGGDGGSVVLPPRDPANQYTSSEKAVVYHTSDYWLTTNAVISPSTVGDVLPFVTPLVGDPHHSSVVYMSTNYLYRWHNNLKRWDSKVGGINFGGTKVIQAIAVAPSDSNVLYVATASGAIWMSTDGGTTWNTVGPTSGLTVPEGLNVLSYNPYDVIVVGSGAVLHCTDTSASTPVWTSITGNGANALPAFDYHVIARNPYDPTNVYFIGCDYGGFYTVDGGVNWYNMSADFGLPNVQINDIQAELGTGNLTGMGILTIGTFGRGVYQARMQNLLTTFSISPDVAAVGAGITLITVTGNHFTPNDSVYFANHKLLTGWISSTELQALIPAEFLTKRGSAEVYVNNPDINNHSNSQLFLIGTARISTKVLGNTRIANGKVTVFFTATNTGTVPLTGITVLSGKLAGKSLISFKLGSSLNVGATTRGVVSFPATVAKGHDILTMQLQYDQGREGIGALVDVH